MKKDYFVNKFRFCLPEYAAVLWVIISMSVAFITAYMFDNGLVPFTIEKEKFYTVLIASFAGSGFAFYLKKYDDKKELIKKEVAALNFALIVIKRQLTAICTYEQEMEKYSKHPLIPMAFLFGAYSLPDFDDSKISLSKLRFLLKFKRDNLLFDLKCEQDAFDQFVKLTEVRRCQYVNNFLPAHEELEKHGRGFNNFLEVDINDILKELEEIMGKNHYQGLIGSTDILIKHMNTNKDNLLKLFKELNDFANSYYPEAYFIKLDSK